MVPNPDYEGPHKPKNAGLTFKFYTSPDAAYSDVQAGNLDVLDQVPPSALQTFEEDDSVNAYNEPGSSFSSLTIPERLAHFKGEEGDLRRAGHLAGDQPRGDLREDLQRCPYAGQGLHVSGPGRLDRPGRGQRGAEPRRHQGEAALGRCQRDRRVGRQVPARLQQRRRRQQGVLRGRGQPAQEHAGHRRLGEGVPDVRRAPQGGHRAHHQDRVPHRLAGRLPVDAQLPRARSTARVPVRTTATTATRSSTSSSPRPPPPRARSGTS